MVIALIAFVVFLLLGMPIPFVLGSTGIAHIINIDPNLLSVVPQRIFAGINSSSLSAIPFFIIAGELMGESGVSNRLLQLVRDLIGWVKGGLGYATLIIAGILSSVLGSPNAVSSILCKTMIPDMKKDGYNEEFTGALIAASGVLAIIPPSSALVIYSVIASTSIQKMYSSAVVPSLIIMVGYGLVVYFYVRKNDIKTIDETGEPYRFDVKKAGKSFVSAIPALLVPTIMVGGSMSGVFTPTEAGAISCVAALLAGLIYRTLDLKKVPQMLGSAAASSAVILFIIAMGNILGYSMAVDKIPQLMSGAILGLTASKEIIILLMLLVLIVVGCLMESTAGIMIFAPVMIPIATAIGMDPIHFGIVFTLMMTVALITPPVGMLLFVTSNVGNIPIGKLFKRILPFALVALAITMSLAYLEDLVMFVPRLMGY